MFRWWMRWYQKVHVFIYPRPELDQTGLKHVYPRYWSRSRVWVLHKNSSFSCCQGIHDSCAVSNQKYKDSLNVFQLKVLLSSLHQQTATNFCHMWCQSSNYEANNWIFVNNSWHLKIAEICTAKIWQSSCKKWNIFLFKIF